MTIAERSGRHGAHWYQPQALVKRGQKLMLLSISASAVPIKPVKSNHEGDIAASEPGYRNMPENNRNRPVASNRTPALPARQGAPVVSPKKSKLSVMPLAVLLPPLGELSSLQEVAPQLERRLAALQGRAQLLAGDEGVENARRNAEESMLNQVLQWLSVGESEK